MGKHIDELGSYQDFRAPWETETGDEAEVDKGKLKKLLFNARSAKAAAQDKADEAAEKLAAAEKDLADAKTEAASANGDEAQKKIDKLQAKVDELTAEKTARDEADALADLRKEVLGDFAEKHPKAAKYVKGTTEEELEKSLAEVKSDWGISDDDDDEVEEDEPQVRTTPRARLLVNAADAESGKPGKGEYDYDKVADMAIGSGSPFG